MKRRVSRDRRRRLKNPFASYILNRIQESLFFWLDCPIIQSRATGTQLLASWSLQISYSSFRKKKKRKKIMSLYRLVFPWNGIFFGGRIWLKKKTSKLQIIVWCHPNKLGTVKYVPRFLVGFTWKTKRTVHETWFVVELPDLFSSSPFYLVWSQFLKFVGLFFLILMGDDSRCS